MFRYVQISEFTLCRLADYRGRDRGTFYSLQTRSVLLCLAALPGHGLDFPIRVGSSCSPRGHKRKLLACPTLICRFDCLRFHLHICVQRGGAQGAQPVSCRKLVWPPVWDPVGSAPPLKGVPLPLSAWSVWPRVLVCCKGGSGSPPPSLMV